MRLVWHCVWARIWVILTSEECGRSRPRNRLLDESGWFWCGAVEEKEVRKRCAGLWSIRVGPPSSERFLWSEESPSLVRTQSKAAPLFESESSLPPGESASAFPGWMVRVCVDVCCTVCAFNCNATMPTPTTDLNHPCFDSWSMKVCNAKTVQ